MRIGPVRGGDGGRRKNEASQRGTGLGDAANADTNASSSGKQGLKEAAPQAKIEPKIHSSWSEEDKSGVVAEKEKSLPQRPQRNRRKGNCEEAQ